ncbi:translocation/assembly module TamB domain-containing protein [uncultured Microscilla sp.]|uniref:translocation/assembly module TamB domain-containing protein n=1 Tax=uncultured Microscilla sp. TaxID=432653 RepID=UPI00262386C0|nr:translocation/assembly module TamB domain-containing protein [uncultured Microscilla sp.]
MKITGKKIIKFSVKFIVYSVASVLLLFSVVWGAIQIPAAQQYLVDQATGYLRKKLKTKVDIKRVNIEFFKTVVLEDIFVADRQDDTLLYAKKFKVTLHSFSLLDKQLQTQEVGLEGVNLHLHRSSKSPDFNYQFLIDAFSSDSTKKPEPKKDSTAGWDIDLHKVRLKNLKLHWWDDRSKLFLQTQMKDFKADFETLGLENKHPIINELMFDGLDLKFRQAPHQQEDSEAEVTLQDELEAGKKLTPKDSTQKAVADTLNTALNSSGYKIDLKSLVFKNCNFRYDDDSRKPANRNSIDYNHLVAKDFSTDIRQIKVGKNNLSFDIRSLAFAEKSGFRLRQLALSVDLDYPQVSIDAGKIQTNNSVFHRGFKLRLPSLESIEASVDSTFFDADFTQDSLGFKDITFFTGALPPALQDQTVKFGGSIKADKNKLYLDKFMVGFNARNSFETTLEVNNFTDYAQAHYNLNLHYLKVAPAFLQSLLPAPLPAQLMLVPDIRTELKLKGYLSQLEGDCLLQTVLGELESDFTLQTNAKFDNNRLKANLSGKAIQVGTLVGVADVGALNFSASTSITQSPHLFRVDTLNADITSFEYKKYVYKGLKIASKFVDNIAESKVVYKDDEAHLVLRNVVNLREKKPTVFLLGDVHQLHLKKLNLFDQKLDIKTQIVGEIQGFDADSLTGYLKVTHAKVAYQKRNLELDSLRLTISQQDSTRNIVLKSDIMDAHVKGQFHLSELPQAFDIFAHSYYTGYASDSLKLKHTEQFTVNAHVHKNPRLLYAFVPTLKLPFELDIDVTFDASTNFLMAQISTPALEYAGQKANNFYLNLRTRRNKLKVFWSCSNIETKENIDIKSPIFRTTIEKDKASFNFRVKSDSLKTDMALYGKVNAKTDTFAIALHDSFIEIEKQKWKFKQDCKITFNPYNEYLFVDSLALTHNDQSLLLQSRTNDDNKIVQELDIIKFDIDSIPLLFGLSSYKLGGVINGNLAVTNVFDIEKIISDIKVKNLRAMDIAMGDLTLGVSDKDLTGVTKIQVLLKGRNNRLRANGSYDLNKDSLYLFAGISQIRLEPFKPLVSDYITKLHGRLSARLRVAGPLLHPNINGDIRFKGKNTVQVKMLGEPHFIEDQRIYFDGDQINFKNFTITDQNGQTNTINGKIHNLGFSAFYTNLKVKGDNFQLMKSSAYNFKTLYGTIVSDYDIKVDGLLDDLKIKADVTVKPGSNVHTSIDDEGAASVRRSDFIKFVDADSTKTKDTTKARAQTDLTGFTVNSVIRVTPETKLHIIIDEATNDRMECSGTTTLSVNMDSTGEIEISGDYVIETGKYTMNLFEVVRKEIEVQKGSSVHFFGDPMQGIMNITAIYETKTSTYSLLQDRISSDQEIEQAKRIIPVQVLVHLRGKFLEPQISFDIELPKEEVRNPSPALTSKLNEIRNNQNELYKQVFGLIVLGHFITAEEAQGSNGVDVTSQLGSGLSGFLSSQLNKLSDDYLGGVQIDLDLNNRSDYSQDRELAVQLSKKFFNDRLKVSVGSFVSLDNHDNNEENSHQNLIGDVTVEYRLNESGNLSLKFFRRTNNNSSAASGLTQQNNQTNGFSVSYQKNFNKLGHLFRRKKVKNSRPPKKEKTQKEDSQKKSKKSTGEETKKTEVKGKESKKKEKED